MLLGTPMRLTYEIAFSTTGAIVVLMAHAHLGRVGRAGRRRRLAREEGQPRRGSSRRAERRAAVVWAEALGSTG